MERLRTEIESFELPQVGKRTVSVCFTCLLNYEMVPALVQKADIALYHSKNTGRNKVADFKDISDSGVNKIIKGNDPELF